MVSGGVLANSLGVVDLGLEVSEFSGETLELLPSEVGSHSGDTGLNGNDGVLTGGRVGSEFNWLGGQLVVEGVLASIIGLLESSNDSSDSWSIEPLLVLKVFSDFSDKVGSGLDTGHGIVPSLNLLSFTVGGGDDGEEQNADDSFVHFQY